MLSLRWPLRGAPLRGAASLRSACGVLPVSLSPLVVVHHPFLFCIMVPFPKLRPTHTSRLLAEAPADPTPSLPSRLTATPKPNPSWSKPSRTNPLPITSRTPGEMLVPDPTHMRPCGEQASRTQPSQTPPQTAMPNPKPIPSQVPTDPSRAQLEAEPNTCRNHTKQTKPKQNNNKQTTRRTHD